MRGEGLPPQPEERYSASPLLREAAHALAHERGHQGPPPPGPLSQQRFKTHAERLGLTVEHDDRFGWSAAGVTGAQPVRLRRPAPRPGRGHDLVAARRIHPAAAARRRQLRRGGLPLRALHPRCLLPPWPRHPSPARPALPEFQARRRQRLSVISGLACSAHLIPVMAPGALSPGFVSRDTAWGRSFAYRATRPLPVLPKPVKDTAPAICSTLPFNRRIPRSRQSDDRGVHVQFYDPDGALRRPHLPLSLGTEDLLTLHQLRAHGLRPGGQPPSPRSCGGAASASPTSTGLTWPCPDGRPRLTSSPPWPRPWPRRSLRQPAAPSALLPVPPLDGQCNDCHRR